MPVDYESPDSDNEALARRMEQSAARLEKLATDFSKGGIERTLTNALRRNQKEMERQLSSLLRETLLSALGGGGGFGGSGGRSGGNALTGLIGSFIPGFARGGVISGRTIIGGAGIRGAGEAGHEVILPLKKGRDGRLGVVAASQNGNAAPATPRKVEVTISSDSEQGLPQDDAFREAVAEAVADALDGAVDERIALHLRSGGMLDGRREWQ